MTIASYIHATSFHIASSTVNVAPVLALDFASRASHVPRNVIQNESKISRTSSQKTAGARRAGRSGTCTGAAMSRGAIDLRDAGQARPHAGALVESGNVLERLDAARCRPTSISPGRSARGPMKLMSPRKMFQSCGSSSIAVARSRRPTRVTRGSCSVA